MDGTEDEDQKLRAGIILLAKVPCESSDPVAPMMVSTIRYSCL
jgi:hypothetical protein